MAGGSGFSPCSVLLAPQETDNRLIAREIVYIPDLDPTNDEFMILEATNDVYG
jgi:hypothetical protein